MGGGSTPLVVNVSLAEDNVLTLDKTWQEIYDAFPNVYLVALNSKGSVASVVSITSDDYYMYSVEGDEYFANTPNGYPTCRIK